MQIKTMILAYIVYTLFDLISPHYIPAESRHSSHVRGCLSTVGSHEGAGCKFQRAWY